MPVDGTVPVMRNWLRMLSNRRNLRKMRCKWFYENWYNLLCLSLASNWFDDSVRLDVSWSGSESDSSLSGSLREWRRLPFELCRCTSIKMSQIKSKTQQHYNRLNKTELLKQIAYSLEWKISWNSRRVQLKFRKKTNAQYCNKVIDYEVVLVLVAVAGMHILQS